MPESSDFDLLVEGGPERYQARVISSPGGSGARHSFTLAKADLGGPADIRDTASTRGTGFDHLSSIDAAQAFGSQLFSTVFAGDIFEAYVASYQEAKLRKSLLRIRLRLAEARLLHDVPWEFLYDDKQREFLTLQPETTVIRSLDVPQMVGVLAVTPPLHLLIVLSDAHGEGLPKLQVEEEWRRVTKALETPVRRGLLEVHRLDNPTLDSLDKKLSEAEFHVLHYVGHSRFDEAAGHGALLLKDDQGRPRAVTDEALGTLLRRRDTLRLVVLNSCEGARATPGDPLSGAAGGLIARGIPAVVAMQYSITDAAALTFSAGLYSAIADGHPVDEAVNTARRRMFMADSDSIAFATPVLYLRAATGELFSFPKSTPSKRRQLALAALFVLASFLLVAAAYWRPSFMPTLTDETLDGALAGLGIIVERVPTASHDAGRVLKQEPEKDGLRGIGDLVTLTVAEKLPKVTVPGLTNRTPEDAAAEIEKLGLRSGGERRVPSHDIATGFVIGTSPEQGSSATTGDPIEILVSDGPPWASEVDKTIDRVSEAAAAAGLPRPDCDREPEAKLSEEVVRVDWRLRCHWYNERVLNLIITQFPDWVSRNAAYSARFVSSIYPCMDDVAACAPDYCRDLDNVTGLAMVDGWDAEGSWKGAFDPDHPFESRYYYATHLQKQEDPKPDTCHRFVTWTQGPVKLYVLSSAPIAMDGYPTMQEHWEFWATAAKGPLGVADQGALATQPTPSPAAQPTQGP